MKVTFHSAALFRDESKKALFFQYLKVLTRNMMSFLINKVIVEKIIKRVFEISKGLLVYESRIFKSIFTGL